MGASALHPPSSLILAMGPGMMGVGCGGAGGHGARGPFLAPVHTGMGVAGMAVVPLGGECSTAPSTATNTALFSLPSLPAVTTSRPPQPTAYRPHAPNHCGTAPHQRSSTQVGTSGGIEVDGTPAVHAPVYMYDNPLAGSGMTMSGQVSGGGAGGAVPGIPASDSCSAAVAAVQPAGHLQLYGKLNGAGDVNGSGRLNGLGAAASNTATAGLLEHDDLALLLDDGGCDTRHQLEHDDGLALLLPSQPRQAAAAQASQPAQPHVSQPQLAAASQPSQLHMAHGGVGMQPANHDMAAAGGTAVMPDWPDVSQLSQPHMPPESQPWPILAASLHMSLFGGAPPPSLAMAAAAAAVAATGATAGGSSATGGTGVDDLLSLWTSQLQYGGALGAVQSEEEQLPRRLMAGHVALQV